VVAVPHAPVQRTFCFVELAMTVAKDLAMVLELIPP